VSLQIDVQRSTGPTTCPLCRSDLAVDRTQVCSGCGTVYHRACLIDLGGCGTLGCWRRGAPLPRVWPRGPNPNNTLGNCLLPLGIGITTVTGLAALTLLGGVLHPPRRYEAPPPPRAVAPPPSPPPPPAPITEATRSQPWTTVDRTEVTVDLPGVEGPPPSMLLSPEERLAGVTRAMEAVRADFQLLDVCARAEQGSADGWSRGVLEQRLTRLDADPVADARSWLLTAREGGATATELEAALRSTRLSTSNDDRILRLIQTDDPSPLAGAVLGPRLRVALGVIEQEATRAAAAEAYVAALEKCVARDGLVATVERLLARPERPFDPAMWTRAFDGPDPHERARAARRRFVAAGGDEVPDRAHPRYDRPAELRAAELVRQARGVLAVDDASPTPTQRVLAALAERAAAKQR